MKALHSFIKSRNARFICFVIIILISIPSRSILAEMMQSTGYKIESDSINIEGKNSSSTSYILDDTAGELSTGDSNSTNFYMHAGFWQMQESYISISTPSDLALTSIQGLSGGATEGTLDWLVKTDNVAGYTMTIASSTTPSLQSGSDSFADYAPSGGNPDYTFTNTAANSSFGFSPEGTEVTQRYKDNGSICNTGSSEASGKCWDGLSTTPKTIAGSTTSNHTAGNTTTVRFRAESGASHIQTSGDYTVSIIITAMTL